MKRLYFLLLLCLIFFADCSIEEKPVRFAIIPDTQSFFETDNGTDPLLLYKIFDWVKDKENGIDFMIQNGDITEDNDPEMWKMAKDLFYSLDGELPYTYALGNHDMGSKPGKRADTRNTGLANMYMDLSNLSSCGLVANYPTNRIDNLAHVVNINGIDFLIISLEFGPRAETIDWADSIMDVYPDHKVIINTHAYTYSDNTRIGEGDKWNPHSYGLNNDGDIIYDGEELWANSFRKHKNIIMVVSGHILNGGTGTLVSKGDNGNNVCQMLANYQRGVKGMGNGDKGYIRVISYYPRSNRIEVKTYSPILDKYLTSKENQFTINLD